MTVFADDIHAASVFTNEAGMLESIRYFGYLVDAIHDFGLVLSPSESCII